MRLEELMNVPEEEDDQDDGLDTDVSSRQPYREEKNTGRSWLSGVLFLLFILYGARSQVLTGVGRWLIVSDTPTKSDLLIVLCGDSAARAPQGADLYKEGLAPRIIVIGSEVPSVLESLGRKLTSSQVNALHLRSEGVPDEAIEVVTSTGTSTWEEATYTRQYMTEHKLKSLIVVTSKFHTRRAKYTFQRALRGTGVRVEVVASKYDDMKWEGWWTREKELIAVNNEYLKLLHYGVKYLWR